MTAKAPQEKPIGATKPPTPCAPPTTEYVGRRDLPLLESERKDFKNKIRQLQEEKELITTSVLQQVTRIINVSEDLTQEQRDSILNQIWKGYKEKTNEIG